MWLIQCLAGDPESYLTSYFGVGFLVMDAPSGVPLTRMQTAAIVACSSSATWLAFSGSAQFKKAVAVICMPREGCVDGRHNALVALNICVDMARCHQGIWGKPLQFFQDGDSGECNRSGPKLPHRPNRCEVWGGDVQQ